MYVMNRGKGQSLANPDVAKTPPFAIPAPFPNVVLEAQAVPSYQTVMLDNFPILTNTSNVPMSTGDEAGTFGGVASQIIKGPRACPKGSQGVFVGGAPITTTAGPATHNGNNASGVSTAPGQTWWTVAN